MAIYKPTDCSPFNGVFDVMEVMGKNSRPIYLECKIDSANTPVSAYSIEIYNSENKRVFPTETKPVEGSVTMISDLKSYTSGDPFNIKAPTNTGYNGTYLKIPFIVNSKASDDYHTVNRNQVTAGEVLTNGGKYYWTITLYQEITVKITEDEKTGDKTSEIVTPSQSKYYDMPVVSGQVIGSNAGRLQTELVPQAVGNYQTLSDLVLQDKYVQLYKTGDSANGVRALISSFDYLYGHIMPSKTSTNTITDDMVNDSSYLKVFKFGNDPSVLGTTDKVDIFYNGVIPQSGTETGNITWKWEQSFADASQSYWEEKIKYKGADNKPTAPYSPFGSEGPKISGNERIIFNGCVQKQYNGIFYPGDISVDEIKDGENVTGYNLTIIWYRTTDANNWGSLSNKIVYVNGPYYDETGTKNYTGTNVQIDAFQQFGTINQTPFVFVKEKPIKLRNKVNATLSTETNYFKNSQITLSDDISSISSIVIDGNTIPVQNYVFESGSNKIALYGKEYSGAATVSYYVYDENEYRTDIFKNAPPTESVDGKLYIRPSTSITKDMIFKELTSSIYSRWFKILDFNTDFYYVTYKDVYQYNQNSTQTDDPTTGEVGFDIGTRYQIKSFFKKSDYNPFDLYLSPKIDVKISLIGEQGSAITPDDDGNYEISGRNISAIATYKQNDYIWWESYQWILYSMNGRWQKAEILQKTEEIYSGEIKCDFYGLTGKDANGIDSRYYLTLIIKTNAGAIIEKNLILIATFGEVQFDDKVAHSNFDCDLLAVDIDINTSTNFILPLFSDKCVFDSTDAIGENKYFKPGDKTYVINPGEITDENGQLESAAISKINASNKQELYSNMQETMRYVKVGGTDGIGRVKGFQRYGKSAFIKNDGVENKSTTVENTTFADIDVVENDMILETKITINPNDEDKSKEYVGDIFSIKDEETENKISFVAPDPITEDGLVSPDRNKFLWKHSGVASSDRTAKNRDDETNFWQNNDYVTVSIYQPDGYSLSNNSKTNLEDIKYINDDGTGNNYGKDYNTSKGEYNTGKGSYINMPAGIVDGGSVIGYSTYGDSIYIVHEIFTKQSAFENNEKYIAKFSCQGAGTGSGPNLCVRGIYSSMFSTKDNPAKPYENLDSDVMHDVVVGKDAGGNIITQKKSVLSDSDSKIWFYDSDYKPWADDYKYDETKVFFFYSGRYYKETMKRVAGSLMINNRFEHLETGGNDYNEEQYSITGLQKIVKQNAQNPERQQLNGKTISIKADVGVSMEIDQDRQGYWISGGGSN